MVIESFGKLLKHGELAGRRDAKDRALLHANRSRPIQVSVGGLDETIRRSLRRRIQRVHQAPATLRRDAEDGVEVTAIEISVTGQRQRAGAVRTIDKRAEVIEHLVGAVPGKFVHDAVIVRAALFGNAVNISVVPLEHRDHRMISVGKATIQRRGLKGMNHETLSQ